VLSQYDLSTGERIWILTDPDTRTTVLLASEYRRRERVRA
jgi:hypothetical protein